MPNTFQPAGAAAIGAEMATLATWASGGKGGFVQGKLKVAPDQLPTVKAAFVQAKEKFIAMQHTARQLENLPYPAEDEVSKNAVNNLRKAAGDTPGCLGKTLVDCIARCDDMINQVEQTMKSYQVADSSAEIKFNL
jgi:hypothetical protein